MTQNFYIIQINSCEYLNKILSSIELKFIHKCLSFESVPWNQQTLAGYIAEASFITFSCETYLGAVGAPLLLFISFCLFHDVFYKMFRHFINELNHSDAERNNRELLRKIVKFHNSAKE